jgi:hypothetical protein
LEGEDEAAQSRNRGKKQIAAGREAFHSKALPTAEAENQTIQVGIAQTTIRAHTVDRCMYV